MKPEAKPSPEQVCLDALEPASARLPRVVRMGQPIPTAIERWSTDLDPRRPSVEREKPTRQEKGTKS